MAVALGLILACAATALTTNRARADSAAFSVDADSYIDVVKGRGYVTCGVGSDVPGFMYLDRKGAWSGLAVDVCRALAAMTFGDAGKVKNVPLAPVHAFTALQSGDVDVLAASTAYTLSRDALVDFAGIYYYDGQGFMVPRHSKVRTLDDLHRATICLQAGTTIELDLADYFRARQMAFHPVMFERLEEVRTAYLAGRCDGMAGNFSTLHAMLATLPQQADQHIILRQSIAKTAISPATRHGDTLFANMVRWSIHAMIEAEELGITSGNVDEMRKSDDPAISRMLGVTPGIGHAVQADDTWAYNIIKQVGNYGESYDRNLGKGSPLGIPRSLNALWTKGGLLYARPIR
jgi:general L-amino acid transport system substrate-binding protein